MLLVVIPAPISCCLANLGSQPYTVLGDVDCQTPELSETYVATSEQPEQKNSRSFVNRRTTQSPEKKISVTPRA